MKQKLLVKEIYKSLQGEGPDTGLATVFVRLSGCNLRCTYCDTAHAFKGGSLMSIHEVRRRVASFDCPRVLITGGEPLIQRPLRDLLLALSEFQLSVETHGEISLAPIAGLARMVMDIKTPDSKTNRGGYLKNLEHLNRGDVIKFVIASPEDYAWAREQVRKLHLPTERIYFSAAAPAEAAPGEFIGISAADLADKILEDRLPVRFQTQLHKVIWGANTQGV